VLPAGGALAEPVEPQAVSSPAVMAAGYGDWLWVLWLGSDGSTKSSDGTTQIVARQIGQDWLKVQSKQMSRVVLAGCRGDRLDVILPDGSHYFYRPDGAAGDRMATLPAGMAPVALAGDGNRMYAIASRVPASQPATMSDRGPVVRSLHLLAQDTGAWKELAPLPNTADLLWAEHLSLVVHLGRPIVLAEVAGRLLHAEWIERPGGGHPTGPLWQVRPVALADGADPVKEIKALSINKRLYMVGWTGQIGAAPFIARVDRPAGSPAGSPAGLALLDSHELADLKPALDLRTRYRQWDLAECGDRLVVLRIDPDGPGLQVRRYDPQTRAFDGDWQAVAGMGQSSDWVSDLLRSPLFVSVALGLLVALFVIRRPGGVIRLPVDVEPAPLRSRALALILDAAPCLLAAVVLIYGADITAAWRDWDSLLAGQINRTTIAPVALWLGLLAAYGTVAEALFASTPGKRLLGLSVFSVRGVRPGPGQALARNLLKIVDLPLCLVGVTLVLMVIHPAHQRIGDLLGGTIVVGPRRTPLPPWVRQHGGEAPRPPGEDDPPSSPS
jgi:uncharacterized RDD family membrane protein YckC